MELLQTTKYDHWSDHLIAELERHPIVLLDARPHVELASVLNLVAHALGQRVHFAATRNANGRFVVSASRVKTAGESAPPPRAPALAFIPHPVTDLLADLRVNLLLSPWARSRSLADWIRGVRDEAVEAAIAVIWEQRADAAEELGDTLWNWLSAALTLEKDSGGAHTVESIIRGAQAKLRRRKPWIFAGVLGRPQPSSPEEEHQWVRALKAQGK